MRESILPRTSETAHFDWAVALACAFWILITILAILYLAELSFR